MLPKGKLPAFVPFLNPSGSAASLWVQGKLVRTLAHHLPIYTFSTTTHTFSYPYSYICSCPSHFWACFVWASFPVTSHPLWLRSGAVPLRNPRDHYTYSMTLWAILPLKWGFLESKVIIAEWLLNERIPIHTTAHFKSQQYGRWVTPPCPTWGRQWYARVTETAVQARAHLPSFKIGNHHGK